MTSVKPRHGRFRLALAGGLAVFITLAGTGIANAGWLAAVVNAPASAAAGTIGISQAGFASTAVQYSSSVLAQTAPITVTNTGTIPAPYTLTLGAAVATLGTTILVNTWPVASAADCLPGSAVPGTASSSSWSTMPPLGGSLAAGVAAVWCVRTSMTAAQVSANSGASMTATLALVSNVGSWVSSVNATAVQSAADTSPPTEPGIPVASATTDTQTTLSWSASTDNVAVTGYEISRGGVLITTVAATTYTDTGLSPLSSNVYTIRARDAAGNTSTLSLPTTVTTLRVNPGSWYTVKSFGGRCVQGAGTAPVALRVETCVAGNQDQEWQFVETATAGNYKIVRRSATTSVWNVASKTNNALVSVVVWTGTPGDQWQLPLAGGTYGFKSAFSARCLEGAATVAVQVKQVTCNTSSSNQYFSLTAVP